MAEAMRLRGRRSVDVDAHDLVTQALPHLWRMSVSEQLLAQKLLQQAATLEGPHGRAHVHALLGWTYMNMFNLDSHAPISELTEKALEAGATALALDEQDYWGHLVLGLGHARQRRPEDAVRHLSQSVEINPNFALGHAGLGYALACGGQPQRGLEALDGRGSSVRSIHFLRDMRLSCGTWRSLRSNDMTSRLQCAGRCQPVTLTMPAHGG